MRRRAAALLVVIGLGLVAAAVWRLQVMLHDAVEFTEGTTAQLDEPRAVSYFYHGLLKREAAVREAALVLSEVDRKVKPLLVPGDEGSSCVPAGRAALSRAWSLEYSLSGLLPTYQTGIKSCRLLMLEPPEKDALLGVQAQVAEGMQGPFDLAWLWYQYATATGGIEPGDRYAVGLDPRRGLDSLDPGWSKVNVLLDTLGPYRHRLYLAQDSLREAMTWPTLKH